MEIFLLLDEDGRTRLESIGEGLEIFTRMRYIPFLGAFTP